MFEMYTLLIMVRICPIATPEGPNIGLVGHLASYAKLNSYGFLEVPYRKVIKGKGKPRVSDEIVYIDAFEEEKYVIADATIPLNAKGEFLIDKYPASTRWKSRNSFN